MNSALSHGSVRRCLLFLATVAFLRVSLPALGQISAGVLQTDITQLASDAYAGRGSGTNGNDMAARYIAQAFKRAGLKPVGTAKQYDLNAPLDGSGYFQPFAFTAGVTKGKNNKLQVQMNGKPRSLKLGAEFEPSPLSASGKATGTILFAGYGIRSKEPARDDYMGLSAKGKVVMVVEGAPGNDPHSPLFEHADTRRKAMAARDQGAAALLVIPAKDADLPRMSGSGAADAGIPVFTVRRGAAKSWLKAEGKDLDEIEKNLVASVRAFDCASTATVVADVRKVQKTTANIAGLLEGADPEMKKEAVVIGAHMDHLGMGGPHSLDTSKKPAIHYGADDNASGTAGVLGLAAYFSGRAEKPKRSLLFLCFSGEELGLLGSAHYVKNPLFPINGTAAMVNMDMIGRMRNEKLSVIGTGTSPQWPLLLEQANRDVKLGLSFGESGFGGSDHQSFYAARVPVLFFFTGLHEDYHRPTDTADKIDIYATEKVVRLVADTVSIIADMPVRPAFASLPPAPVDPGRLRARASLGTIPEYGQDVQGVPLGGVRPGSPAEKAGLQKGDIIVKFGGRTIRNVEEYTIALGEARPGDVVEIVVKRGGETLTLKATLAEARR